MRISLADLPEGREALVVEVGLSENTSGEAVPRIQCYGRAIEHPPGDRGFPLCRFLRSCCGPSLGRRLRWRWGLSNVVEKRFADLGIVSGSRIRVLRKAPFGGPIEVEVSGSRFLIGRRLAERIIVEA
ncbi:MAG: ferrous iron transport protein A [Nitrososphaeria archaeon]|nr:ferrous iron transport protein A [Nitrososphaeria archaeon]